MTPTANDEHYWGWGWRFGLPDGEADGGASAGVREDGEALV